MYGSGRAAWPCVTPDVSEDVSHLIALDYLGQRVNHLLVELRTGVFLEHAQGDLWAETISVLAGVRNGIKRVADRNNPRR